TVQHLESENVVGVVRGADAALRDQYVAFSAHWDHLGIGPVVNGDSIYNGSLDNASGTADVLAIARAAAEGPAPKRSLVFVFVTGEESGLLGSEFFARNPSVPIANIVANLNIDGGNVLGRAVDFRLLGENKSSLGPQFASLLQPHGWRTAPDEHPERGYFYRSDHFSFAKAGVPSVSIAAGTEYEGKPSGWGTQQEEAYTSRCYHQPCDEYNAEWDLSGGAQLAELVLDFGLQLANGSALPTWNADAEFRRPAR
ncbi:MAG TPA: M28 family peptidase, partial [Longimicrobium sp.]|nr:M28 family peptidase [Longimicrobium sp.]